MTDPLAAVEAFVLLAREARRRALSKPDRQRLAELEEDVREMIDGSKPAHRRIEGHQTGGRAPPLPAPAVSAGPGPAPNQRPGSVASLLEDLAETGPRVEEVGLDRLPPSRYTPSRRPAHLAAYFDDAVATVDAPPPEAPTAVVDADGRPVSLPEATRDLWGVGAGPRPPPPTIERPRSVGARPAPARASSSEVLVRPASVSVGAASVRASSSEVLVRPASVSVVPASVRASSSEVSVRPPSSELSGSARPAVGGDARANGPSDGGEEDPTAALAPAIVHLKSGGTHRGYIARFDPIAGLLELVGKRGSDPREVRLDEILVIFFGRRPELPPSERSGPRVQVTLANDRRVTGFSPDYQPHGSALTVIPEVDRGGVDRVWIPAWSVKALAVG